MGAFQAYGADVLKWFIVMRKEKRISTGERKKILNMRQVSFYLSRGLRAFFFPPFSFFFGPCVHSRLCYRENNAQKQPLETLETASA